MSDGRRAAIFAVSADTSRWRRLRERAPKYDLEDADIDALTRAGWDDGALREMTRLIAFYNFTGRLEAASGLPKDVPDDRGLDRFTGRVHSGVG